MFCPKCATQNVEGASFCRVCGANIGLVPQALTGQLPTAPAPDDVYSRRRRRLNRDDGPPSLEKGIGRICSGLGFIVASLVVMFWLGGFTWGWVFLIPGFSNIGKGIAAIVAAKRNKPASLLPASLGGPNAYLRGVPQSLASPALETRKLNTNELIPPVPSVTEGTTRHLGAEGPTQHFDTVTGEKSVS